VHKYVDRDERFAQTPCTGKGLRHAARVFANQGTARHVQRERRFQLPPAPYMVAVTQLRPEFLLR
jgi:hypothetical protein